MQGFRLLPLDQAEIFFSQLTTGEQIELIDAMPTLERRTVLRVLAPDDVADIVQAIEPERREPLLTLLDDPTRQEVTALLAYGEDEAGGLMNPRYVRLRPEMTVDEAISYLRLQSRGRIEVIYYGYVLDQQQRLLGVVSIRNLVTAPPNLTVADLMSRDIIRVREDTDQEEVSRIFAEYNFIALPVVDADGRMKGIVTVDDIVDVVEEEATEDIQMIGGMSALDDPYLDAGPAQMFRKRVVWLIVLFLGQTLTASVIAAYQQQLERAVILTLFMPLILSSGGNSGSQAATLVVRAIALGQVGLGDWLRVIRREALVGICLGGVLGGLGLGLVIAQSALRPLPVAGQLGPVALTIGISLVCVVLWGTIVGSMLPLGLRRLGLDPASASTPFVATCLDVTGLIIYFTVATTLLSGTLLN